MAFKLAGTTVIDDSASLQAELGDQLTANTVLFEEYDNGNSSTAATINWNNGQKQKITMTDDCAFTFTDPTSGEAGSFLLKIVQDGTGGHTALSFPSTARTPKGELFVFSSAANAVDILGIYFDGTNYFMTLSADFTAIS